MIYGGVVIFEITWKASGWQARFCGLEDSNQAHPCA